MWFLLGMITLALSIAAALKLRSRSAWRGQPDMITIDGARLRYEYGTVERNHRVIERLWGVSVPAGYDFRLHRESWFDRICRGLGANAERSVGDPDFDAAFFIESDDGRLIAALRDNPALREQMLDVRRELRLSGLHECEWEAARGRLWLRARDAGDPKPELTIRAVATLHELSRILTAVDGASTQVDDPFVRRALLLLSLNLGFVALAIATLARMRYGRADLLDPGPMLAAVLMPALLLATVYLVSAARWLRSSARAHRVLAELIVLGVPAMVCCSFGVVREANMTFDASAPAWRVVELATTEVRTYRCGRGNRRTCRTYLLHLPGDIDTGRTPRTLELDRAEFASLPRRGPVAVDLRPGALGFAWVAAKRPG